MHAPKQVIELVNLQEKKFYELLHSLHPRDYSVISKANDEMATLLTEKHGFTTKEYLSGTQLNGWEIPSEWELHTFTLKMDEVELFNENSKGITVAEHSPNTSIYLDYNELLKGINVGESDALPWDWRNLYRHKNDRQWSLAMSRNNFNKLKRDATYHLKISSFISKRTMKVLVRDSNHALRPTILINAHNDHPRQFNDDLSGVIASILLQEILKEVHLKFNVRTLIGPEHYGPMFFLNSDFTENEIAGSEDKENLFSGCIILASIAEGGLLKLQQSFNERSTLNFVASKLFKHKGFEIFKFRQLHGNDEIIFECPPYKIPTITLTRFPFQTYHTTADVPSRQSWDAIKKAIIVTLEILLEFESQETYLWGKKGLQKYDSPGTRSLFKPAYAPNLNSDFGHSINSKWNELMNNVPMMLDLGLSTEQIAGEFQLSPSEVSLYLNEFEAKGIIKKRYHA